MSSVQVLAEQEDNSIRAFAGCSSLADKISWLYKQRRGQPDKRGIRKPYRDLLAALGSPQQKLPPVIHIAGTNGKGSVLSYLRTILQEAGYRVHGYSSPHLVRYNERIVLSGQQIEDSYLETLFDQIFPLASQIGELDFFEITTALAFKAFAENEGDLVLLETGLGGRFDCTNVIEKPLASVITSISYDHMDVLGDNIIDIAYEKAGIIKKGTSCFIGAQSIPGVLDCLGKQAAMQGTAIQTAGYDWVVNQKESGFVIQWRQSGEKQHYPLPALTGDHQIENTALALAVLKGCSARFPVSEKALARGISQTVWPGRLQKLSFKSCSPDWEIWLDSGHNEAAGKALACQAAKWRSQDEKDLHLVVAMTGRKDIERFLKPLAPFVASLTALPITAVPDGGASPDDLAAIAKICGIDRVFTVPGIEPVLARVLSREIPVPHKGKGQAGARILITGSVYLAGEVLKHLEEEAALIA